MYKISTQLSNLLCFDVLWKMGIIVMLVLVLRRNVEMMPLIHHLEYVMSYILIRNIYGHQKVVISMKSN